MNGLACALCHRNDPGQRHTCDPCLAHIAGDLERIVELTALAFQFTEPQKSGGDIGNMSGKPGSRPPIDLGAIDAQMANDALPLCESWERLIREQYGLSPYGPASLRRSAAQLPGDLAPATLTGCAAFLRSWLPRLNEDPGFPLDDLAREIRNLTGRLRRFDQDLPRPAWRVPCPADHPDHQDLPCGHRLPIDRDHLDAVLECPRCHAMWTADRLLLVALADPATAVWATAADCEAVTGVPARTLRAWAESGRIGRRGTLYDVGAVLRTRRAEGA